MAKAKKPNEIREEMRKQLAAKYKQDIAHRKISPKTSDAVSYLCCCRSDPAQADSN